MTPHNKRAIRHDLHALRAAGTTIRDLCQLTGLSHTAVHKRLTAKPATAIKPHRRKGTTQRPCMCCGKPFLSEGAHNRLCQGCRRLGSSPYDTPAIVRYR